MSEAMAAGAMAPLTGERPRVSAASFRNLTARLKKAEDHVQVPDFAAPVWAPAPAPAPVADPLPPEIPPSAVNEETAHSAPVQAIPAEPVAAPEVPAAQPSISPPVVPQQVAPTPAPAPVKSGHRAWTQAPAATRAASNISLPDFVPLDGEPPVSPVPAPMAQPMAEQAAPADAAPAETPAEKTAASAIQHGVVVAADDAADAARKEALSRKEALELDVIWRSLLANPTMEERAQFLKDVAILMAAEGVEMPAPEPEHDLSKIAPAELPPEESEDAPEPEAIETLPEEEAVVVTDLTANADPNSDNAELARSLLDMMASGSSSGLPHERALAADTLLRMLPKLDVKPLVMMAQRLAKADNPPQMLVAKLIRDPRVEVAGPLLEDCPQISDKDLETVVTEADPAKLRMLARRRHLTSAISDALIKTNDGSVMLTLVRNMDAQISQEGFVNLICAAEREKDLLAPLCTRADLPAPLAFELFWLAPPQLRRFILSRFLTDSETLTKILKITLSTNEPEELGERDSSEQHRLVEALERAARGKLDVASDELAQVLQISSATALRILNDPEGEPLVVMLKVAGFPRQALPGVLKRFRDADLALLSSGRDLDELRSIFDTLSFNKARILLTYWDWAQRKTGPYAPLH